MTGTRFTCSICRLYKNVNSPMIINPRNKRGVEFCFVAEAPGEEEDRAGRCLVGRSGRLMRDCIEKAGIKDYHFTNVVKCRPHEAGVNYKPTQEQVSYCLEILLHELLCIAPKYIVLLGDTAAKAFGFTGAISNLVGKTFVELKCVKFERFKNCRVFVLFHPAYILRNPKQTSSYIRDLERIKLSEQGTSAHQAVNYNLCISKKQLKFQENLPIAFDFETNGLDDLFHSSIKQPKALCISFCQEEGNASCLSLNCTRKSDEMPDIFQDYTVIAHNIKYDYKFLKLYNQTPKNVVDTIVMALLIDENQHSVKLKQLAYKVGMQGYEDSLKIDIGELESHPVTDYFHYNCGDADATLRLYNFMLPEIRSLGLESLMHTSSKYQLFLAELELNGIFIDRKVLNQLKGSIDKDIKLLENKLSNFAQTVGYEEVNFNSGQQLSDFLINGLNLNIDAKTATGLVSTDKGTIEDLYKKTKHPFLVEYQKYKKLCTIKSTFIDKNEREICFDGRLYPKYNLSKAVTGRLSSEKPNLQNQFKVVDRGDDLSALVGKYNIRRLFTVPEGFKFVEFDYSQLELRIMAFIESVMMDAFKNGKDLHQMTADILKISRKDAKTVNFGIIYGASPAGLYRNLLSNGYDISYSEANGMYELYMHKYKGIKNHFDNTKSLLRSQGWVKNYFGRRRRFPLYKTTLDKHELSEFVRQAVNFPIQSTAADIMMYASVAMFEWLLVNYNRVRVIGNVHDALLFEIKNDPFLKANIAMIKKFMETSVSLPLPMIVDTKIGDNWGELEDYK